MKRILILIGALGFLVFFASAAKAEKRAAEPEISAKLDDIRKTQQEILNQLEQLKQDIYVVKIRATR